MVVIWESKNFCFQARVCRWWWWTGPIFSSDDDDCWRWAVQKGPTAKMHLWIFSSSSSRRSRSLCITTAPKPPARHRFSFWASSCTFRGRGTHFWPSATDQSRSVGHNVCTCGHRRLRDWLTDTHAARSAILPQEIPELRAEENRYFSHEEGKMKSALVEAERFRHAKAR